MAHNDNRRELKETPMEALETRIAFRAEMISRINEDDDEYYDNREEVDDCEVKDRRMQERMVSSTPHLQGGMFNQLQDLQAQVMTLTRDLDEARRKSSLLTGRLKFQTCIVKQQEDVIARTNTQLNAAREERNSLRAKLEAVSSTVTSLDPQSLATSVVQAMSIDAAVIPIDLTDTPERDEHYQWSPPATNPPPAVLTVAKVTRNPDDIFIARKNPGARGPPRYQVGLTPQNSPGKQPFPANDGSCSPVAYAYNKSEVTAYRNRKAGESSAKKPRLA